MPETPLKYRLQALLDSVPRSVEVRTVETLLDSNYGINRFTFRKHKALPLSDKREMSEATLAKYAAFFGVSEKEIRNYEPFEKQKSKSVFELLRTTPRPTLDSLAALTGMTASV